MSWTAASVGYFLSSLFENSAVAAGLAPALAMPMMLFGGLLANNKVAPWWIRKLQYLSPMRYGAEALLQNELMYDQDGLKDGLMEFLDYNLGYWNCIFIFIGIIIFLRVLAFIMFKMLIRKF